MGIILNDRVRTKWNKPFVNHHLLKMVKENTRGGTGLINLPSTVTFPKALVGKRVRILFELVEDEKDFFDSPPFTCECGQTTGNISQVCNDCYEEKRKTVRED